MGRIRQIKTDFLLECTDFKQKNQKKSVSIRRIRPIRSSIVSVFSKGLTIAYVTYVPMCLQK